MCFANIQYGTINVCTSNSNTNYCERFKIKGREAVATWSDTATLSKGRGARADLRPERASEGAQMALGTQGHAFTLTDLCQNMKPYWPFEGLPKLTKHLKLAHTTTSPTELLMQISRL